WMTPPVGIDAAGSGGGVVCAAWLAFGLGAWIVQVARRAPDWRIVFAGALALITCLVAAVMRGHNGGFLNVYIPLHWLVAAGFGFAATELARIRPGWVTSGTLAALGILQVGWQLHDLDTRRLIPTPADVAAGDEVVAALREHCHGEILSPYAAWLPVQAGRAPSWHLIALWDIQHAGSPYRAALGRIAAASRAHRWACVIEGGIPKIGLGTTENYKPLLRFSLPGRALQPKSGWRVRPNGILVPKENSP
ncbi:MAG: hypothetical protein H0V89_05540, partial [Deltaproteobacteria bacterium]|nr:hypothetical protein [Deltaproteobacteria bacterium]